VKILGVDFTSRPTKRKAITVARGTLRGRVVALSAIDTLDDFEKFEAFLREPGPWIGGFDFPFSLPRELVETLEWPKSWPLLIDHVRALPRAELRDTFRAFCNARAVGNKFAHRKADLLAGSSSSMKWVNPPVAYMFHEGAPRLLDADVSIPVLRPTKSNRVALEAYPAFLSRKIVGRQSYKNDEVKKQTPERTVQRKKIIDALGSSQFSVRVESSPALRKRMLADASGDLLDAVLCLAQAAIASRLPNFGIADDTDALEGGILLG
jgi:hypothetical protein